MWLCKNMSYMKSNMLNPTFVQNLQVWFKKCDKQYKTNLYHAGTDLIRLNTVNIMLVHALAPCVARTSAPIILTM